MFKKILVPLDGSSLAEGVLPQVRALARIHGSSVILLRVAFALVFPGADPTEAQVKTTEEAEAYVERIRESLEKEGITVEARVRYGFPSEEILAAAGRGGVDLIAMATHGRSGPVRWMLGSVAEQVVRHAGVPVLLIRVAGAKAKEKQAEQSSAVAGGRVSS